MQIQLTVDVRNGIIITPGFGLKQFPLKPAQVKIAIENEISGTSIRRRNFLSHLSDAAATGK
jgi:hypothetical protein